MAKKRVAVVILALAAGSGLVWLAVQRVTAVPPPGTLYGNVEIRQVDLAFNAEGRVTGMARREGDAVHAGDVLAELDDATYRDLHDLAQARRGQAQANLALLLAGTRVEEIDQARARVTSAEANVLHAEGVFARQADLVKRNATSRQEYDDARLGLDAGRAQLGQLRAALAEAVAGPRPEEIEAARAALRAGEAEVALAAEALSRTHLVAPADGVVMTRVIEPGTVGPAVRAGLFHGDCRRGLGACFCPRAVARAGPARPGGAGAYRWRSRLCGADRLSLPGGRVHSQDGGDPGAAHAAGLSPAHSHRRPG